jgi:hypothetical protein
MTAGPTALKHLGQTNRHRKYTIKYFLAKIMNYLQFVRTFKCEVQKYHKELKKTEEGEEKDNFSLGLRLILY